MTYTRWAVARPSRLYRSLAILALLVVTATGAMGCAPPPDPRFQREARSSEPNNTFDSAIRAIFDSSGIAYLWGLIDLGDIDVYDLGSLQAGDHVRVQLEVTFGDLLPTTAIFDVEGRLFVTNPVDTVGSRSFEFSEIVRHDSSHYFLGIAEEFGTRTAGSYELTVTITRGGQVPAPRAQIIVLDFDGGRTVIDNVGTFNLSPFSAADVDFDDDQTEELIDIMYQTFDENFLPYDVVVLTTDDQLPDELYSVIHFGGRDPDLFGISENIDFYNRDPEDQAIIFVGSFVGVFGTEPTLEQMGEALGNVGSHEAGHLLGLNHVSDPYALMDSTHPPDAFRENQDFLWTRLARQIFPIGTQDAPLLLYETVGTRP